MRGLFIPCVDAKSVPIDTTARSPLHHFVELDGSLQATIVIVYGWCVALTYLPLLLVASWSLKRDGLTHLPFLLDWNIAFTFLISFPTLVLLIVSDERGLALALKRVWASGVISNDVADGAALAQKWSIRFRRVNACSYFFGLSLGGVLSWYTLKLYEGLGFWAAPTTTEELGLVGYIYLYCISLLYAVITVFVFRSVVIAFFLSDLVKQVTIRLLPFHPDGCGGLQPVGRLGLRNQYTLTILGVNIAILAFVTLHYLKDDRAVHVLIIMAVLAYAVLGPIVFIGPLLPFRTGMLRSKAALMGEVSERLRTDFTAIRSKFRTTGLSDEDLGTLERLKKVGAMIEELPVWPFDSRTLRTFGSAYVTPFVIAFLSKGVESLLVWLGSKS
jgi:hypothetical protein